jgi:hypothetical protein
VKIEGLAMWYYILALFTVKKIYILKSHIRRIRLTNSMEYKGDNTPFTTYFPTACVKISHQSTLLF